MVRFSLVKISLPTFVESGRTYGLYVASGSANKLALRQVKHRSLLIDRKIHEIRLDHAMRKAIRYPGHHIAFKEELLVKLSRKEKIG
jgi:hypothetical protein